MFCATTLGSSESRANSQQVVTSVVIFSRSSTIDRFSSPRSTVAGYRLALVASTGAEVSNRRISFPRRVERAGSSNRVYELEYPQKLFVCPRQIHTTESRGPSGGSVFCTSVCINRQSALLRTDWS